MDSTAQINNTRRRQSSLSHIVGGDIVVPWHSKSSTFKRSLSVKCGTVSAAMRDPIRIAVASGRSQ
jgi:hypothetical protein